MNIPELRNWSERQQVLAIIVMAGLLIFLLWFFLLTPVNRSRQRLETRIRNMRSQLAVQNYLLGEDALRERKKREEEQNALLRQDWQELSARVAAFQPETITGGDSVGHIDFKVALFDVRERLIRKSRDLDLTLPRDMGMEDAVYSHEDARTLMIQLRAVEKLVDLMLDIRVGGLREIQPLPAVVHTAGVANEAVFEEYPVQVLFTCDLETFYRFLRALLEPGHVFTMRRLRIQADAESEAGIMKIETEVGALVFLKSPEQLEPPRERKTIRTIPRGH